jgi:tetrahydromethanopterin S-methyltransferase subunit G
MEPTSTQYKKFKAEFATTTKLDTTCDSVDTEEEWESKGIYKMAKQDTRRVTTSPEDDRFNKLERRFEELADKFENVKRKYNQLWGWMHELDETIMEVHMIANKNSLDIAKERAKRKTIDSHDNTHD